MTEACLVRLAESVAALTQPNGLLDRLQAAIYDPRQAGESDTHSDSYESKVPWNTGAASLYFSVIASAVEMEQDLRYRLTDGGKLAPLPADNAHERARQAFRLVVPHAHALYKRNGETDHSLIRYVDRTVHQWVLLIKTNPDVDDMVRLRRIDGSCPNCGRRSLVVPADCSGDVTCTHEDCVDSRTGLHSHWNRSNWPRLARLLRLARPA